MRLFGELDAKAAMAGRPMPTADLLIACCALYRGDEILTLNPRDFQKVPGLVVHELG
jgi:predicted nucleic acid-binding protein